MSAEKIKWYYLSIGGRIYLGYGLLSLLLLVVGAIALWGVNKYKNALTELEKLNTDFEMQVDIDASTQNIQRHVIRFIHENLESAAVQVIEEMDALRSRMDAHMATRQHSSGIEATLREIKERLEAYRSTFEEAFKEKAVYKDLIDQQLPHQVEELHDLLSKFNPRPGHDYSIEHGIMLLIRSQKNLLSYFTTKDYSSAHKSQEDIARLREWLNEINLEGQDKNLGEIELIKDKLMELDRLSNRAVQAARSYLFMVNVVMSAEAAEMLYQTGVLRKAGMEQKTRMRENLKEMTNVVMLSVLLLILGTIVGGLGYAILTTHKITAPISAITQTFRELSQGRHVEVIPGSDNTDEIGDLAYSANVFRKRNEQTVTLLQKADELTRNLQEKTEQLETTNGEMEQFVYIVSHDLKSPIVTIMGFMGMIKDLASKGKYEEAFSRLHRIEEATTHMGELINDLLDLSRAGRADEQFVPVNTDKALRSLLSSMEPLLQNYNFAVQLKGDFPTIHGNESRFEQIFENLITNAMKYGEALDGGSNRVDVSCSINDELDRYIFEVRDYGRGIPAEFREKVFTLFSRLDQNGEGTGVGLTIVRKLTRLHGGDVWIEPHDGPGALFRIAFPVSLN